MRLIISYWVGVTCCISHCMIRHLTHDQYWAKINSHQFTKKKKYWKANRLVFFILVAGFQFERSTHHRHKYDLCCLVGHADTWLDVVHQRRHFHVTLNTTGEWKHSHLTLSIYTYMYVHKAPSVASLSPPLLCCWYSFYALFP